MRADLTGSCTFQLGEDGQGHRTQMTPLARPKEKS